MKAIVHDFKTIFKNMNLISKYTIKYGTVVILTLTVVALFCLYKTTAAEHPYLYIIMYDDLLYSIKECIGAVYVLPFVVEAIFIARGKPQNKE